MMELHLRWLELCVLVPLLGALVASRYREPSEAHGVGVAFALATLSLATGAWFDFIYMRASVAEDKFHLLTRLVGHEFFQLDEISAPLLPLGALLFALVIIATVRS